MILRQCMGPVFAGVLAGVFGAARLGPMLTYLMASAQPAGVWMQASAGIAIATATACAIWAGAGRVMRMNPTEALRVE